MALGILALALITASGPPDASTELQRRSRRVAEIFKLAGSGLAGDLDKVLAIARGPGAVWERTTAVQALTDAHRESASAVLKPLMMDPDPGIRTEATIRVYRWTRSRAAFDRLVVLRDFGSNLRRAFQTGNVKGRPVYADERAANFFQGSMRHSLSYTRLDGALGLIEMNREPARAQGLKLIEEVLASDSWGDRLAAVRYMSVEYTEGGFAPLLRTASTDRDSRVQAAALEILARP